MKYKNRLILLFYFLTATALAAPAQSGETAAMSTVVDIANTVISNSGDNLESLGDVPRQGDTTADSPDARACADESIAGGADHDRTANRDGPCNHPDEGGTGLPSSGDSADPGRDGDATAPPGTRNSQLPR